MEWTAWTETVAPLLVAAALGSVVGIERESWQKPAGLRTHMMVALGSATFTNLALRLVSDASDPSRIVIGIATGLGFLGAGSIIRSGGEVHGITTASGIWVVGAAGACCGARHYDIAVVAVLLSLIILAILGRVETGPRE
jgi:putative Mg2+ transporter-C (MgtC) family protein